MDDDKKGGEKPQAEKPVTIKRGAIVEYTGTDGIVRPAIIANVHKGSPRREVDLTAFAATYGDPGADFVRMVPYSDSGDRHAWRV